MKLKDRNIILTGASRGFGRYLAKRLWAEGANLIAVARTFSLDWTVGGGSQELIQVRTDLAVPHYAIASIMTAADNFTEVHGLINNAAVQGPVGPVADNALRSWIDTLTINLIAPMLLCRDMAECMKPGAKIVNLSGGGAANPRPNFSAYATSKAGLVRFSETLAEELKDRRIDVNCVSPGPMLTDMTAGQDMKGLTQEKSDETMAKAADLIVFLLSSESDGITGRLIAAQWDDFKTLVQRWPKIVGTDMYTLRRVVAKDRGEDGWDK